MFIVEIAGSGPVHGGFLQAGGQAPDGRGVPALQRGRTDRGVDLRDHCPRAQGEARGPFHAVDHRDRHRRGEVSYSRFRSGKAQELLLILGKIENLPSLVCMFFSLK